MEPWRVCWLYVDSPALYSQRHSGGLSHARQELISCPERYPMCVAKTDRLTIPLTTISTMNNTILYTRELSAICDAITGLLKERNQFDNRWPIAYYVDRCISAGFCVTPDDMRQCAMRYIAGKRRVTPPGTRSRKRLTRRRQQLRTSMPPELLVIITQVVSNNQKVVQQYHDGNERAINSLVGQVMKQYRYDAAVIKEALLVIIK